MNKKTKIMLFLSAYSPLFIIISIIYCNFNVSFCSIENLISIFFLLISILSNIIFILFYFKSATFNKNTRTVISVENKTSDILNYLIPFVIAILSTDVFNLLTVKGIICFIIIMSIIYSVHINSNLLYFNPLLTFFHIKFYQIIDEFENTIIIMSKKPIKKNNVIKINKITQGLYKIK